MRLDEWDKKIDEIALGFDACIDIAKHASIDDRVEVERLAQEAAKIIQ